MESLQTKFDEIERQMKRVYVKRAPHLPKKIAVILVRTLPYIIASAMVSLVCNLLITFHLVRNPFVSLIAGLGGFVLMVSPEAFGFIGRSLGLTALLAILWLILVLLAMPHLLHRNKLGWKFVFYATLVTMFDAILYLDLGKIVLHMVIVWYLLLQIRRYYH